MVIDGSTRKVTCLAGAARPRICCYAVMLQGGTISPSMAQNRQHLEVRLRSDGTHVLHDQLKNHVYRTLNVGDFMVPTLRIIDQLSIGSTEATPSM